MTSKKRFKSEVVYMAGSSKPQHNFAARCLFADVEALFMGLSLPLFDRILVDPQYPEFYIRI